MSEGTPVREVSPVVVANITLLEKRVADLELGLEMVLESIEELKTRHQTMDSLLDIMQVLVDVMKLKEAK